MMMYRQFTLNNSIAMLLWIFAICGYLSALTALLTPEESWYQNLCYLLLASTAILSLSMVCLRDTHSRRMAMGYWRICMAVMVFCFATMFYALYPFVLQHLLFTTAITLVSLALMMAPLPWLMRRHRERYSHKLSWQRQLMLLSSVPAIYALSLIKFANTELFIQWQSHYSDTLLFATSLFCWLAIIVYVYDNRSLVEPLTSLER